MQFRVVPMLEVTGRSAAETIGKNCRFLNKGCENDPETLQFMRDIQSSPEAAAEFRQNYPEGKQSALQTRAGHKLVAGFVNQVIGSAKNKKPRTRLESPGFFRKKRLCPYLQEAVCAAGHGPSAVDGQ